MFLSSFFLSPNISISFLSNLDYLLLVFVVFSCPHWRWRDVQIDSFVLMPTPCRDSVWLQTPPQIRLPQSLRPAQGRANLENTFGRQWSRQTPSRAFWPADLCTAHTRVGERDVGSCATHLLNDSKRFLVVGIAADQQKRNAINALSLAITISANGVFVFRR